MEFQYYLEPIISSILPSTGPIYGGSFIDVFGSSSFALVDREQDFASRWMPCTKHRSVWRTLSRGAKAALTTGVCSPLTSGSLCVSVCARANHVHLRRHNGLVRRIACSSDSEHRKPTRARMCLTSF
jgi:hypothetical protein